MKEDQASRQRSNLEGGHRMVIEEVDDEDDSESSSNNDDDDDNDDDEMKADEETDAAKQSAPQPKRGVEIEEVFDDPNHEDVTWKNFFV